MILLTATNAVLNTKATDVGNKIPGITNLATKTALNLKSKGTENKIANINLVTKAAHNTKASETEKNT